MKVYVITSGEYSDYRINAVSLDYEDAERKCAVINDGRTRDFCEIKEYDTDDIKGESPNELKTQFKMTLNYIDNGEMYFDGGHLTLNDINTIKVKRFQNHNRIEIIATFPKGTESEKAKKIMLDRIAKFKAERAGIV